MIPFVTIKLGKEYKLRFGMAAMIEFEQATGIKIKSLDDDMSVTVQGQIIYYMMKQEDPTLTFKAVCDLIDENADNIGNVIEKINEAIRVAFIGNLIAEVETPTPLPNA